MKQVKSKKALQLFIRQRELKAIYNLFTQVNRFSETKKRQWLKENSELVTDAFMSFLELNKEDIDQVSLNQETSELSLEFLELLTQTTDEMERAFDPKEKLEV